MLKSTTMLVLCLLMVLSVGNSFGAETDRSRHDRELMFGISGLDNIRLNTFGGSFGFRYFLSTNFSLRPTLSYSSNEIARSPYYEDWSDQRSEDESTNFSVLLEQHMETHGRIFPYWGVGFSMGSSTSNDYSSLPDSLETGMRTLSKTTSDRKSIISVFGVQWRASDAVRLGCEYNLQYRYEEAEAQSFYFEEETRLQDTARKFFGAYSSSIYLAVHF